MTDLRQAAQQAIEALDSDNPDIQLRAAVTLRAALAQPPAAQPEQEPTPWRDMVVVSLVREGINKHKARELADHFATQPLPVQPEQCQPLTDEEIKDCLDAADQMYCERDGDKELFMAHAVLAARNKGAKP